MFKKTAPVACCWKKKSIKNLNEFGVFIHIFTKLIVHKVSYLNLFHLIFWVIHYYKESIQFTIEKWIYFNYIYRLVFSKAEKDLDWVSKLKKNFLNLL